MSRPARRRCLVLLLSLCALAAAVPAAEAETSATGRIAFASGRTGNFEIFTMNADGSGQTQRTFNAGRDEFPSWSPDGEKIAYSSQRDGNIDVYVMDADGSNVTRLTTTAGNDVPGNWSPDGTKIAFASERDGNFNVYVMNADGSDQTRLTSNPETDTAPRFSPDGTKIAFSNGLNGFDIRVMNADGTGQTSLTPDNSRLDQAAAWAPDGSKLVFESIRNDTLGLFLMNPDGSGVTRLTSALDQRPAWSPDSNWVVFARTVVSGGTSDIYRLRRDGTDLTRLTTNFANDVEPNWGVGLADTTPPVLTLPGTITREATSASGASVTYTATAADDVDGPVTPVCSPASGSTFAIGSTSASCTATDQAGNTSSGSFAVVVQDTTAPVLSVPGTITVDATSPAGAAVTYSATAADAVGATVGCSPASGSTFAIGTTAVSCTAMDGAGNSSGAGFSIVVKGASAQITDLAADIRALNLKEGISNSLDAKLQNLLAALDDVRGGAKAAACNKLDSVVNEVNAQAGKEITAADAAVLLAELARIRAVLAC